jgi:hypothetical protein
MRPRPVYFVRDGCPQRHRSTTSAARDVLAIARPSFIGGWGARPLEHDERRRLARRSLCSAPHAHPTAIDRSHRDTATSRRPARSTRSHSAANRVHRASHRRRGRTPARTSVRMPWIRTEAAPSGKFAGRDRATARRFTGAPRWCGRGSAARSHRRRSAPLRPARGRSPAVRRSAARAVRSTALRSRTSCRAAT